MIDNSQLISRCVNLAVEIPTKAIVKFSFAIPLIPISLTNHMTGHPSFTCGM